MSQIIKQSMPCVVVDCRCGRAMDRSFDYVDKVTHQTRHVVRKVAQVEFDSADGMPALAMALPVRDWDVDVNQFQGKRVKFLAAEFTMSNDGVNLLRFCGYEVVGDFKK